MIGPGRLRRWTALPPAQRWMLATLAAAVGLASIDAPYPTVAPLHHVPTVAIVLAAPWLLARWPLSNRSVACVLAFMLLHTLGGRYTYTNLPYDAWAAAMTGHSVSEVFGFTRNHYDRLVHFAFGALMAVPVVELSGRRGLGGVMLAIGFALAAGAFYEIFEWGLTLVVAGADADAYNGQQGDMWDAQKDMALAALGALIVMPMALKPR